MPSTITDRDTGLTYRVEGELPGGRQIIGPPQPSDRELDEAAAAYHGARPLTAEELAEFDRHYTVPATDDDDTSVL